jgi:hypothetical protein
MLRDGRSTAAVAPDLPALEQTAPRLAHDLVLIDNVRDARDDVNELAVVINTTRRVTATWLPLGGPPKPRLDYAGWCATRRECD